MAQMKMIHLQRSSDVRVLAVESIAVHSASHPAASFKRFDFKRRPSVITLVAASRALWLPPRVANRRKSGPPASRLSAARQLLRRQPAFEVRLIFYQSTRRRAHFALNTN